MRASMVFEVSHRGITGRAFYLDPPDEADAEVEMLKDGEVIKTVRYPAYRVWNVAAHWTDIVDDYLQSVIDVVFRP